MASTEMPKMMSFSAKRSQSRESAAREMRRRSEVTGDTIALSRKSRGMSMVQTAPGFFKPASRCEQVMRRFTDSQRVHCQSMEEEMDEPHCMIAFPTGSSYSGPWNVKGMTGYGVFTFPEGGVVYEGHFEDGQCHGEGSLLYEESGTRVKAVWCRGFVVERTLIFADGLEYVEDLWNYCKYPDRRFTVEYDEGIPPAGRSYLTAEDPPRPIPPGYYDTGYGFFHPKSGMIFKYDDLAAIIRYPTELETKWIVDNCRTNPDRPVGRCPFFYEVWVPPTLEFEEPPLPAARTKTFHVEVSEDELWRDYEDDEARWRKMRFSRASRSSRVSRTSRISIASQASGGLHLPFFNIPHIASNVSSRAPSTASARAVSDVSDVSRLSGISYRTATFKFDPSD